MHLFGLTLRVLTLRVFFKYGQIVVLFSVFPAGKRVTGCNGRTDSNDATLSVTSVHHLLMAKSLAIDFKAGLDGHLGKTSVNNKINFQHSHYR